MKNQWKLNKNVTELAPLTSCGWPSGTPGAPEFLRLAQQISSRLDILNENSRKTQWKLNENSMKTQWKLNEIFWLILIEFNWFWLVCAFAALFRQMKTPWKLHENSMKTPWTPLNGSKSKKNSRFFLLFCFWKLNENSMKIQWKLKSSYNFITLHHIS